MKLISFIICSFLFFSVIAQKHDYIWMTGVYNDFVQDSSFGINCIDFNDSPTEVIYKNTEYFFYGTNNTMCDSSGKLLYYTNGLSIFDSSNHLMA